MQKCYIPYCFEHQNQFKFYGTFEFSCYTYLSFQPQTFKINCLFLIISIIFLIVNFDCLIWIYEQLNKFKTSRVIDRFILHIID